MIDQKKCPACDSPEIEQHLKTRDYFLTHETFGIDKCSNCGLLFTNPRPEDDALDKYYHSEEYLSHGSKGAGLKDFLYAAVKNVSIQQKYRLVEKYSKRNQGKILDYGCGVGSLLHEFKRKGWDVTGIEPNEKAAAYGRSHYMLNIHPNPELLPEKKSFDVIMLWHVIEHLPNIRERLAQLKKYLAPDASLFIAFPNADSPDAKKYGKYWAGLDVPRHLYHFNEKSFSDFIRKQGFQITDVLPLKFDSFYVSLLSEQYKKAGLAAFPKAFFSGLQSNWQAAKRNNYSSLIFVLK